MGGRGAGPRLDSPAWGSRPFQPPPTRPRAGAVPPLSIVATLALATLLAVSSLAGADADPPDPRPNLVVIMTDDQTAESLRVMDAVRSRIGGEGTTFDRSLVNFPLCCPSRATFLTGQYAHNHRVLDNEPPAGGFGRFEELHGDDNLATWLDAAGYRTALVGKYFNGYAEDGSGFVPPGWDEWRGAVAPAQHVYDYGLNENGEVVHYGGAAADFKQDVLTERAVEVIEGSAGDGAPLFLDLAYTAPHAAGPHPNPQPPGNCPVAPKPAPRHAHAFDGEPLPRPPSFDEADVGDKPFGVRKRPRIRRGELRRMTRRYRCTLESLQSVDEGAGEVLDALDRIGELENTVVVFTSDNGFFYGEHRITGGKLRHYEEATRVPLLIRGPGIRRRSARRHSGGQRRPRPDAARRRRRRGSGGGRRDLAAPARGRSAGRPRPSRAAREPPLRRGADEPVGLRRARRAKGQAGAL